jgi:hypothetical protein
LKSKEKKGIVTRWVWGIKRRVEIKRRTHEAVCISQPPPHTKARRRRDEEELEGSSSTLRDLTDEEQ